MKTFLSCLTIAIIFFPDNNCFAQSSGINYSFTQPAGSMTYNNSTLGAVTIFSAGADDQVATINFPPGWAGFYFGGKWVPKNSQLYVSSNGWMSIFNPVGNSYPLNSLSAIPFIIAPLWDDLRIGEGSYLLSGGVGSRALVIEWKGVFWDHNATDSALSFQAVIYDNEQTNISMRNVIEFRYKRNGLDSTYVNNSSGGASIGISGFCGGDVFAFTNSTGAPNNTSPENYSIALKPSDVVIHRFTPEVHLNDECPSAELISFDPGLPLISVLASTLQSTQSPGALPTCGSPATVGDVWFTFTKPAGITNFEIYTDSLDCRGINFNPGIEIFTACGNASLACDFGSTGPAGTNATSYLNLVNQTCNAQQYWVRAYSLDTSLRGYFRFNLRPPGSICVNANDFTNCGLPYTSPAGLSTCGFGNEYDSTNSAPHNPYSSGEDYIFSFTPPSDVCVDVALSNTPFNSSPGLFLIAGCPVTGSSVVSAIGNGGATIGFNNISLMAGVTYYFLIDNNYNGGVNCLTDFTLSVNLSSTSPPVNDNCAAAVNLPVGSSASCTGPIDYNNNCVSPTLQGTVPAPGCGNFIDGITADVWFTFTSTGTNVHRIKIDAGSSPAADDLAMAIYSGTCGNFTLVTCDDYSNGAYPAVVVVPPAAGTIYYVRVWSNFGTHPGNFRICIVDGCSAVNDSCPTAIPLVPGQYELGDNSCATGINEPGQATCWTNQTALQRNTVWYSFVATSDSMKIKVHLITLFDSQIALYESTGPCTNLNQIFCNDNTLSPCGNYDRHSEINATGLIIGNTYYVRVDGLKSNTGTFEIMVQADTIPFPALYAQDCPVAIPLCTNNTITVSGLGYFGCGNICDLEDNSTCLVNGETNSVFYTFNVTGTGAGTPVEFKITPNGISNCDFMLWCIDTVSNGGDQIPAVPNYCDSLSNTSLFPAAICNYSFQGITGCSAATGLCNLNCYQNYDYNDTGMMAAVVVPDGMTASFLLLVNDNFPAGFTLDWMGTPINNSSQYLVWQGGNNTNWSDSSNWGGGGCSGVPNCINGLAAVISGGAFNPVISSNTNVSDITINPGTMLTLSAGVTLSVCGNFTNNGTINFAPGSKVKFIGTSNAVIAGSFNAGFNNFYNMEVAKSGAAQLTLMTDIYVTGYDSIYGGEFHSNAHNIGIGGNFYNILGNQSFIVNFPSTIKFTGRGSQQQHFRNDSIPLTLQNVTMDQIIPGTLTLATNITSDIIIGNGTLTLISGKIVTGNRMVNITTMNPASCTAGNPTSYVEGNLMRAINTGPSAYDFPIGDSVRGYQRAHLNYTIAPIAAYTILAKFRQWIGMPSVGPTVSECGNSGWQILPPYDNGYWTLDASTAIGIGTYNITAYPSNVLNQAGLSFSIMKSVSNNGQGPWLMEGTPFCGSTPTQVRRDDLTSFSDFAVVQSDIGNSIYASPTDESYFKLIPNPAKGKATLYFENSSGENFTVKMLDLTGRTVLRSTTTNNFLELDLDGIDSGVYLLDVNNQNHSAFLKLIVQ